MDQVIAYDSIFPLGASSSEPTTYAPTDWDGSQSQTITLPEFDPSLGTLNSVLISFTVFIHSQGSVVASGDVTVTSYRVQEQIALLTPSSTPSFAIALVSVSPDVFSISNGTTILSGSSVTFGPADISSGGIGFSGLMPLESYEGTGNLVFPLLAHASIVSNVSGGSLTPAIATTAIAEASIDYSYTASVPPLPPTGSVNVQTANGIDLSWATLFDQIANSPIMSGSTATQYIAVDDGAFNGVVAPIKFVFTGSGLTYSGIAPNIELTGGTITGVLEEDTSNNVLATYTGLSISAAAFQVALTDYTSGVPSSTPALNAIFLARPYDITGGDGDDTLEGGTYDDTINGGAGNNTVDYSSLTSSSGLFAIIEGGAGTVNKGVPNGVDTLTGIQNLVDIHPQRYSGDVFEVDAAEHVTAFRANVNYLIELSAGVNLSYGRDFTGITEFVSNIGTNTVNFASDEDFSFLYGSTGDDTLTVGTIGGGYMFGEGGTNVLNGGVGATNFFVGGQGGTDTMNGGARGAENYFFVDGNDQVNGVGVVANVVIELVIDATVQLGSAQYQHVQEFVSNGGSNTVTVANTDSDFIYLYGGVGNDTLTTGSGGGYLFGEGGTNVLTGGGGTNIFVADGASGIDTMNGGAGSNLYYIDANSQVHGAGTFNNVIELQQNVSLVLGSAQLGTDVQQVVLNSGTNSADFHAATTTVFLYGGSGNDTLFGGSSNDFLYGGLGTNTFTFANAWGKDTIEDWTAGANSLIDLSGLAGSGVHAITDLTQTITAGNDVITSVQTGTNSITLVGVGSALTASSFHFA